MGNSISEIGGGRTRAEDKIDHAVGYSSEMKIGYKVESGDTLGILHCRTREQADQIAKKLLDSHIVAAEMPIKQNLVRAVVS